MITGIGTDIIEIRRIAKAIQRERFCQRVFTSTELATYRKKGCNPQTLAGYFAAKEAFAKALGTGFRGFSFRDVEILNDTHGKPYIRLSDKLTVNQSIHVSVSHANENAIAFVILEE